MIFVSSFISDTLNTVDAVISTFVNMAYSNFISANAGMITLLFTVYVMHFGYRFLMHDQNFNLAHVMRHLIVMLIIYGLVMSWNLYNILIYNIFTNEPGRIAQILVNASGQVQSGTTIAQTLDGIYKTIIDVTMGFFGQVSFSGAGVAFIFYAILVFVIGTLLCVFTLLLFIYAKMMMAVALALGPIFILFALWDSTKNLFSAWISKLVTLALIPIVTSGILVLMLSVIHVTLPNINQPTESIQFYGIAPFLGLSLATTLILTQVFGICSSLGGGITLSSLSKGADIAKASLQASGITSAGRHAANWSKKQVTTAKNRLFKGASS